MNNRELNQFCDHLQDTARYLRDAGLDNVDALHQAAGLHGLECIEPAGETDMTSACSIWQTPDGTLVNCWEDAGEGTLDDEGGLGFDDQTEWYTDMLEEQEGAIAES